MTERVYALIDSISYQEKQIVSRTMGRKLDIELPITLYAFDQDENISEESTVLTKMIQVLEGVLEIKIENEVIQLRKGDLFAIKPNQKHAINAPEKCKFLQIESK